MHPNPKKRYISVLQLDSHVIFVPLYVLGRELDAVIVDVKPKDAPFDVFEWDGLGQCLEKFFNLGDCRNISKVFVKGRLVHKRD